jgi:hypothetical protein
MNPCWYSRIIRGDPHITRTDFRIARYHRRRLVRGRLLARALAEYFKTQRLYPQEIEEWDNLLSDGQPFDEALAKKITCAFAEGVLKDDLKTVDEDAFIGTCGQLIFKWIRTQYYGTEIIYASPRLLTDSSKKQGIDYFEILGNPTDLSSLYFIVWEVKATDSDVASRTDEIYRMHRNRTPRLLRGLQIELSLEYPEDKCPVLGTFARQILDHWGANTASKRIGGAVVFDTTNNPGHIFTTFHTQFPGLHSADCRQVILIEVPRFRKTRRELWTYLQAQMS